MRSTRTRIVDSRKLQDVSYRYKSLKSAGESGPTATFIVRKKNP